MQQGQPLAFASRALTQSDREGVFGHCFCMEKFHPYVYGRPIHVESDHKPLEAIFKKPIQASPKRLQSMLLRLQRYDLTVTYKRGKEMYLADTLSRAYLPITNWQSAPDTQPEVISSLQSHFQQELETINLMKHLPISQDSLAQVRAHTAKDECLQKVADITRQGWPESKTKVPPSALPYFSIREELDIQNGVLFKGERVVIPTSLRSDMLHKIHNSHLGINGCLRRAREILYWPGMNSQVKEYIQKCAVCRSIEQAQPKEPMVPHPVSDRPWSTVGVDLFTFDQADYLTVADYGTNFFEVDRLDSTTSQAIIKKLKYHFSRHWHS